ncbi:MAG: T9SS type B sorting domain-containing protein [Chitinophagaceae bacterium]|nr:MAG: T9SS type B sorting domain-containing protein [Chitinophagaceae bacterium]
MLHWRLALSLFGFLLLTSGSLHGQVDLNGGLVANYPFSGNAGDVSGNGHHATVNGGAALTTDRFGNANSAYALDGVNDHLSIADPGAFSSPAITVSIWFYTERSDRLQMAVAKRAFNASNTSEFGLNIQAGPAVRTFIVRNNRPCANTVDAGDYHSTAIPYTTFCVFKWYHVVVTFANGVEKIYVDGQLLSTTNATFQSRSDCLSQIRLGVWWSGDPNWFQGKVDDFRWYNRAINAQEVQALYQSPLPPPPQANCPSCILPQGSVSATSTCAGQPALIPFTATAGTAPFTVQLSNGSNTFSQVVSGNAGTISVTPSVTSTYTVVSIKDATSCERSTGFTTPSVTVTVNPTPVITLTPAAPTICCGNSVQLNATGGTVYQWLPATGLSNASIANPVATPAATTTYKVIVTSSLGCKDSSNVTVTVTQPPSTALFTAPDTVCVNAPVTITNTSTNASTYTWNFCVANAATVPQGTNLGTHGFGTPVFMDYALDGNTYYGFVTNNVSASLVRLNYGNSLLNTPVATNLGNFGGVIPSETEGIQLVQSNGRWYAIIVGGNNAASRIVRLDFGNSLASTPTATNWGNIGNLAYPTDLHLFKSGSNWHGLTLNAQSSTITRFDFGTGFTATPTGVNLGNIGGLNFPTGIYAVANSGNWYAFITNAGSSSGSSTNASLTRLSFGTSLLNTPTGTNLGNPGGTLSSVRDITINTSCSEIVGYAVNYSATNDIVKIDFRNNITSVPIITSLGNLGGLSFPHSISRLFRVGSDLYSFILNANSNTITRLRFEGCTSSTIATSTQQTPPAFSYNAPGVYGINLTADEGLATQSSFCRQIVVVAGQTRRFTKTFCAGDSVRLESPVASGNSWNTGSSASSLFATAPGTYWVRFSNGNCISTDTFVVTQLAKPVIVLTGSGTICAGDSAQLAAGGGTNYSWSPAGTLSNAAIANPKAGPSVNTTYKVVVTSAQGCSDSSTVDIIVNPKPSGSILPASPSICRNDSVQLTASGGGNYQWVPATGLSNANIANPKASPDATTLYKVIVTNAFGCKDSTTSTVTVRPLPVVSLLPASASFCPGDSVLLSASGGATYLWSPAVGLSSTTVSNPKAAPAASTVYQLQVTSADGCVSTASVPVTRKNAPVLTVSGPTSVCQGDSTQLQSSGGTSYQWSPAAGLSNAAIANPKAAPQATTLYQVVVGNAEGCKDSATVQVFVNNKPVIGITPAAATTCQGDSLQLLASGGGQYLWTPATGLSATAVANPKAAPSATTQYQLLVTAANGCKDSTFYSVTVRPKPLINLTASTAICAGDSLQLQAQGGASYQWSPSGGLSATNISNPKAGPIATTDYKVVVTTALGCVDSAQMQLTVRPRPAITINASATICQGDSLQLGASGGALYQWRPPATLSNAAIANPKAGPQATTTYEVLVTSANGCTDSARVTIGVNPKPVITVTPGGSICRGDSLQLGATAVGIFQWNPATGLSSATVAAPKASPASTTLYQLFVTNTSGCKDSSNVQVTVNAKPVAVATPTTRLCLGDTLQLTGSGGGSYQWSPATSLQGAGTANPPAFPQDSTLYTLVVTNAAGCVDSTHTQVNVFRLPRLFQRSDTVLCPGQRFTADASTLPGSNAWQWHNGSTTPSFLVDTPGVYWVHTQVAGCFHPVRDSIVVDTLGFPAVTLGPDRDICHYDNFLLRFQGRNIVSFTWSDGSTDSVIRIPASGTYGIEVTNRCGTARDEVDIQVLPCNDDLYFPSAFTPNGDGKNDRFKAAHLPGVTVFWYELVVHNRWGEVVFRTNNLTEGWDGTLGGKKQDSNVFVWHARYRKSATSKEQFQKGTFLLIR